MANPILTQQTTMTIENGSGTPVSIGGIRSITGIGSGTATEIDTTTLASTAKEFVQGLRDFGSISIDMVRDQDDLGQLEMYNANAAQATREFVITLPSSTNNVITFQGFVQNIPMDINSDGIVTGTATVRITGAPTFS